MIDMYTGLITEQWGNITNEMHRKIRHSPQVVAHLKKKAQECQSIAGENFETGVQNDGGTTRARAYIRPANGDGIHEELSDSVLLKAAAAMRGR